MDSKRKTLQKIAGISSAFTVVPISWIKPVINSLVLPAHAQTSSSETFAYETNGSEYTGNASDFDLSFYLSRETGKNTFIFQVRSTSISRPNDGNFLSEARGLVVGDGKHITLVGTNCPSGLIENSYDATIELLSVDVVLGQARVIYSSFPSDVIVLSREVALEPFLCSS